jgi:hypothetical protein
MDEAPSNLKQKRFKVEEEIDRASFWGTKSL